MLGILVVPEVEGVHNRLQREAVAQFEILVGAEIEREETVVLPQRIATDDVAISRRLMSKGLDDEPSPIAPAGGYPSTNDQTTSTVVVPLLAWSDRKRRDHDGAGSRDGRGVD